jgi:hypothetical protein
MSLALNLQLAAMGRQFDKPVYEVFGLPDGEGTGFEDGGR